MGGWGGWGFRATDCVSFFQRMRQKSASRIAAFEIKNRRGFHNDGKCFVAPPLSRKLVGQGAQIFFYWTPLARPDIYTYTYMHVYRW